jgi:hypothetical protein
MALFKWVSLVKLMAGLLIGLLAAVFLGYFRNPKAREPWKE